jgi:mRNA-degrading endonuclease toxin of MazEF toxin-antitoxin module
VKRGELYLVQKPGAQDPRRQRVFVIVSRQALVDSRFSTVICAPIYSRHDGLSTQVTGEYSQVGTHSLHRISQTTELNELNAALAISLGLFEHEIMP